MQLRLQLRYLKVTSVVLAVVEELPSALRFGALRFLDKGLHPLKCEISPRTLTHHQDKNGKWLGLPVLAQTSRLFLFFREQNNSDVAVEREVAFGCCRNLL